MNIAPKPAAAREWWQTVEGIKAALAGEVGPPSVDDLPAVLALAWASFSALFFAGKLPRVTFAVVPNAPRLVSRFEPQHGGRILLGGRVATLFPWAVGRAIHEAVRVYCTQVLGVSEPSYHEHGPTFVRVANEVGGRLGVPRVHPKGEGAALASGWPVVPPKRPAAAPLPVAVVLPIERAELDTLRREVVELRATLAAVPRGGGSALALELGRHVAASLRKVERSRDALLKESRSGGKAATAREVARVLGELRDSLAEVARRADAEDVAAALGASPA